MIFGNLHSQNLVESFIQSSHSCRTLALLGPAHLGKSSLARELIERFYHPTDYLFMNEGVDGVREAISFCRTMPLNGSHRILLIDNADSLGEPAQDALLKVMEEPHSFIKILMIAHDPGYLQPALRSRIRFSIPLSLLSQQEMRAFAESISSVVYTPLLDLSGGIPGLYKTMMESAGFEEFYDLVVRMIQPGTRSFFWPTPDLIRSLKGAGPVRDAIVHVLRSASRKANPISRAIPVLKFCHTLSHSISASAELHWQRMTVSLSDVI